VKSFYSIITLLLLAANGINAQTVTIYNQNFGDGVNQSIPSGWSASGSNPDSTWYVDNTNNSAGYTDASGQGNMVIRNTVPSGTYTLTTNDIETSGYENIRVLWGRRISNNFTSSGSTIPTLDISIDGGTNWVNLAFYDTFIDNNWTYTNAGDDIILPALADDQPGIRFRWTVNITNNPEGSYRIDDLLIRADVKQSTVSLQQIKSESICYLNGQNLFVQNQITNNANLIIYNIQGTPVLQKQLNSILSTIDMNDLSAGIYIIQIQTPQGIQNKKVALTK
jgi:hypothetical protein